jgi:Flp pilus assembly protein TadG
MGKTNEHPMGFLRRLVKNQAGNTMAIVAAAIIPLAGLIGGGLDMSRAYMVRTRMQQACDAAALAGRRSMTGATMSDADKAEAKKFFDFNFPQNTFGSSTFVPVIRSNPSETTTVEVSAVTTVPTTLMRIFGYETLNIAVDCNSRFDIGNTDVMLVLDTTGSMVQNQISDGKGGSGTTTRMVALQQAVKDFYDTLGAGSDTTGRIRYGFMPYSSTVNVGYQLPTGSMMGSNSNETALYQTRRALYYFESGSDTSTCYRRYGLSNTCYTSSDAANNASTSSTRSVAQCNSFGNTSSTTSGSAPNDVATTTYSYDSFNGSTAPATGTSARKCVRKETTVTKSYDTTNTPGDNTTFYTWELGQFPVNLNGLIAGNSVPNPTYNASSPNDSNGSAIASTMTWSGCIEERSTDSSITKNSSTSSTPATAFDLQIDTLPTTNDTRWRPHMPQLEFKRNGRWMNDNRDNRYATNSENDTFRAGSGGWNGCPSQARRLTSYASRTSVPSGQSSSFNSYVDGLVAVGGTYHTIGMAWGARFLSPKGLFASDNSAAPNGFNISRHIVFMTDGDMSAYSRVYGAWGYQALDQRDGPGGISDDDLTDIHNTRLQMMCNAIKAEGIKIWVIGFRNKSEGDIDTPLQNCASGPNYWMMAYDGATLTQKFKDIAKNIGGLRVSK